MNKPVKISFDGLYRLELLKDGSGNFTSAIITKTEKGGSTPIFDFPVKQIQNKSKIGLEFEFNSKDIFVN